MRKIITLIGLLAVLGAAGLTAACAKTEQLPAAYLSPSPTATKFKMRLLNNSEYKFVMAYPTGWVESVWKKPEGSGGESALQYTLSYADPKGAQIDGSYVDAEQVAVYLLSRSVSSDQLSAESAFKIINGYVLGDLPRLNMRSAMPTKVDVHGDTGWYVSYTYQIGDTTMWAQSILVTKGTYAYWTTGQASARTWHTQYPTLVTALNRFRVY